MQERKQRYFFFLPFYSKELITLLISLFHTDIVEYLILNGANWNLKATNGATPFFLASAYGKVETINLLLSHGITPGEEEGNNNKRERKRESKKKRKKDITIMNEWMNEFVI